MGLDFSLVFGYTATDIFKLISMITVVDTMLTFPSAKKGFCTL